MLLVPNLLITDDDSAFRTVVSEGLSRRGFRVVEARDGQEALDVLDNAEVHIALLDVHMPRVTGLDVIRRFQDRKDPPPFVLMSAKLDEVIRSEAKRLRAYEVVSKPVRLKQLTDVVCHALTEIYGWTPTQKG